MISAFRYDLQQPLTDRRTASSRSCPAESRGGRQNAPRGCSPGDEGISRGIVKWDRNNIAPRVGLAWGPEATAACRSRGRGYFLRQHHRQRVENDRRQQPIHGTSDFPGVFTLPTVPPSAWRCRAVPVRIHPGEPRFTFPAQVFGPSLEFVWPKTYQMNVTVEKELFATSARARLTGCARTEPAGEHRSQLPVFGPGADDGQW